MWFANAPLGPTPCSSSFSDNAERESGLSSVSEEAGKESLGEEGNFRAPPANG